MLEAAVIAARLLQYAGAAILFGTPLFLAYALPSGALPARGSRQVVAGAAALLALASLFGILAQASLFAGSFAQGFTGEAVSAVVSYMALGKAAVVRACLAVAAFALLILCGSGRGVWLGTAAIGGMAAISLAWLGHGASTDGALGTAHLLSDGLHAMAATAWLGGLTGFVLMLGPQANRDALHTALVKFSAFGPFLVALLVLTGLFNGWVLIGPAHVDELTRSPYGRVLLVKIALFVAMLGLAATNRFRHTAAVARGASLAGVRRSILLETAAGVAVLALVAWLGTLAPPAA